MCLAVPMKVLAIEDNVGTVEVGGVRKIANIILLDSVEVGDYVIVHAGFALQVLNEEEAQKTLRLFDEIVDSVEREKG